MRYNICLEGSGGEIMIGEISQKQYDYWKTKDTDEIVDGLHGSHEDEEMSDDVAIEDRFNYMDVFCSSGVYFERFDLTISEIDPEDEDADDAYFCFDCEDHLSALGKQVVDSVKYPKGKKTFLYSVAEEQGILLEEEIELEKRFDIKKLKIKIATLPNNSKLIVGIEYDGYDLHEYTDTPCVFLNTGEGKVKLLFGYVARHVTDISHLSVKESLRMAGQ